jgi:hypothetical protein
MNEFARQLGRLGKGKKKTLTAAQRAALAERLELARTRRWPAKAQPGKIAENLST